MVAWRTLGNAACLLLAFSVPLLILLEVALWRATEGSSSRDLFGYRQESHDDFNDPQRLTAANSHGLSLFLSSPPEQLNGGSSALKTGVDVAASSMDATTQFYETKSGSSSASAGKRPDEANHRLLLLSPNSSRWGINGPISSLHNSKSEIQRDKQDCISIEQVIAVRASSSLSLPRQPFSVSSLTLDPSRRRTGLPLRLSVWPASSAFVIATGEPGKGHPTTLIVSLRGRCGLQSFVRMS